MDDKTLLKIYELGFLSGASSAVITLAHLDPTAPTHVKFLNDALWSTIERDPAAVMEIQSSIQSAIDRPTGQSVRGSAMKVFG